MKALRSRLGGAKGSERVEIGKFLVVESKNSSVVCGAGGVSNRARE